MDLRFNIWKKNLAYIEEFNGRQNAADKDALVLGMNRFGDLSHEEFQALYLRPMQWHSATNSTARHFVRSRANDDLPTMVDWRMQGAVTPVQDQGECGSCWAFSAVAAIESANFLKNKNLVKLSEQQLIDCCPSCQGCQGGFMPDAYQCLIEEGGLDQEDCYPYDEADKTCRYQASCARASVASFVEVDEADEVAMAEAVVKTPLSIAIDASHVSFQFYKSGVYDERACSQYSLDHGVFLVGYSDQGSVPFWIVRNSWGPDWGQQGYIFMRKDHNNQCGVASAASYPVIA
eukprot:GAFH01002032.1.p1 GENE.GAFH01002032.1~~GAFH01002032.1.p1  ORF type:complete len:341 (-),score=45.48 GAFH01002032.1:295-1164(-)